MSKRTLQDYLKVINYIENDLMEITPEELGMVFDGLHDKVDSYKGITDYMTSQAESLKARAKEFSDRAKSLENSAKNIKKHMAFLMSQNDTLELIGSEYSAKIRKSEAIKTDFDPDESTALNFPELTRQKVIYEWNKDALKKTLKDTELPFARIQQNQTIQFRVKK